MSDIKDEDNVLLSLDEFQTILNHDEGNLLEDDDLNQFKNKKEAIFDSVQSLAEERTNKHE